MFENQMKKLSLENCTLQLENKLLKDKYGRASSRISELEGRLREAENEVNNLQAKLDDESNRQKHKLQAEIEREVEQYKMRTASSTKEVEILKSEISFLEDQLCAARKENETIRCNTDKSEIHCIHKQEIQVFQNEIAQLKHLLKESEQALEVESKRCRDLTEQVQKLSEFHDVFQLQMEESSSGGSAAEKQIASLQMRLHVTEERLSQERADRAGNLSQIEEKLLSENAKLQIKAKELERQLKRETEKSRTLGHRASELREENLQLRLAVPDEDNKDYSIPYNRHQNQRKNSQKPTNDIQQIRKQLESESGFPCRDGDSESLIVFLWSKCQNLEQNMKEWQVYLEEFELPMGEGSSISIQDALTVKTEYETKMQITEERCEDISAEKITAEQTYKKQLTDLVKERHDAFARLRTLEDMMDALRAENETLRHGLSMTPGHLVARSEEGQTKENSQVEALCADIASLKCDISQLTRRNKFLDSEIKTLQCQLTSRDKELTEVFAELKSLQMTPKSSEPDEQIKQQRIHLLTSEVASLKGEVCLQLERHTSIQSDKQRLEVELSEIRNELRAVKRQNRDSDLSFNSVQKTQAEKLEVDLEKKDEEIVKLTIKLNETEAMLFAAQLELKLQQKVHKDMENQLASVQKLLDERCQVLDSLLARENEQLEQFEMVKEMVYKLNQGLANKQGEFEVLQLELQQANANVAKLEEKNSNLAKTIDDSVTPREITTKHGPLTAELKISEIIDEKKELEAQMMQTTSALTSLRQDCEDLNAEFSKVKQEATVALGSNIKMTSENAVLERRVKTLEEEKALVKEERDTCKADIGKLETSFHQVVSKFESETKELLEFSTEYNDNSGELKVDELNELHTLQVMIFAKEKENEAVIDKIKRQEQELNNFERICVLLQEENDMGRKDMSRITNELVLKMKESAAILDLNKLLLKEQASLEKKLVHVESKLEQEKKRNDQRRTEVGVIIKKIEQTEQVNLATSLTLQQKDGVISDQQVRLSQLEQDLNHIRAEKSSLEAKVNELTESLRSLSNVNTKLELKIEAKDAAVREEQSVVSKQKEEILTLSHKMEVLQHEQTLMLNNLGSERKVQERLKEDIRSAEENKRQLNEKVAKLSQELEILKGQLVAARETIQQTKDEKETIMKDYQDMYRRLGEKETVLLEVQKKKDEEITQIKEETMKQSHAVSLEKVNVERDLGQLKFEIQDLTNEIRIKDEQLANFNQILQDLEDSKRKILSLESYSTEQEKIATETKILVESLRNELFSLRDHNAELRNDLARKEVAIIDLKDQLRHSGESSEIQVVELKHTIEGMRSHHEYEKKSLRESHNKVEENLKSSFEEIRSLKEVNDRLTEQINNKERLLQEGSTRLSQEETVRKWTDERLSQLQKTIEDLTKQKASLEEAMNKLQITLNKTEAEHSLVKERSKYFDSQLSNLHLALGASEKAVKEKEEMIESLKAEVVYYQKTLEDYRLHSTNKLRKLDLNLKQTVESQEKDQIKLSSQAHQLSVDLEQAREVIVIKNKENLKLQERVLELENCLREEETRHKHTETSFKQEEEMQSKLINRFEEQESELKKLRVFLDKKAEENGDGKRMSQEINHILAELSHQLQFHIETSRLLNQSGHDNSELVHRLRRSLLEAESQLNTERALHAVTRNSMQALDEDCTRLRKTILDMRRRGAKTEKKQKTRMEEINEIIARSQTRAQALLASGEYSFDGSLRGITPSRDYSVADTSFSPDTSFTSEASFGGAHLANLSFLNLSGNLGTFTPRK